MAAPRKQTRWRVRLAALAVGAAGALLLVEIGLRLLRLPARSQEFVVDHGALPDVFVEDPDTFWRLAGDNEVFAANRLGLRGPCPSGPKTPGELRVVCVGDSSTFGYGHRYEDAYGAILGRDLQRAFPRHRVETLLAALPAFSSYQDRVMFERDVVDLEPDVTILYCGAWNDGMAAIGLSDAARAARNKARAANPLFRLRIVQAAARAFGSQDIGRDVASYVDERPDGARVPEPDFSANLEAMMAMAERVDSLVLLVVPPHQASLAQSSAIPLRYRELVRTAAKRRGALLLEAPDLLSGTPDADGSSWFDDLIHPSVAGHRRLAEGLFELLREPLERRLATAPEPLPVPPTPRLEPGAVELFSGTGVRIVGDGLGPRDRVWIGGRWMPTVHHDAGALQVELDLLREVGALSVELVTDHGLVVLADPLTVRPPRSTTGKQTPGGGWTVTGAGPAGWLVVLWCAPSLRARPAPTPYGNFALQDASPEPFQIESLTLDRHLAHVGADGRWRVDLPASAAAPAAHLQVLYLDPEDPQRGILGQVGALPR